MYTYAYIKHLCMRVWVRTTRKFMYYIRRIRDSPGLFIASPRGKTDSNASCQRIRQFKRAKTEKTFLQGSPKVIQYRPSPSSLLFRRFSRIRFFFSSYFLRVYYTYIRIHVYSRAEEISPRGATTDETNALGPFLYYTVVHAASGKHHKKSKMRREEKKKKTRNIKIYTFFFYFSFFRSRCSVPGWILKPFYALGHGQVYTRTILSGSNRILIIESVRLASITMPYFTFFYFFYFTLLIFFFFLVLTPQTPPRPEQYAIASNFFFLRDFFIDQNYNTGRIS